MSNFRILLFQELAGQVKTFTFWVMIPAAFIISLLVSNLQIISFKDRQEVFREQELKSKEALQNVHFYSQLKVEAFIPPTVLSIFLLDWMKISETKLLFPCWNNPNYKPHHREEMLLSRFLTTWILPAL